MSTISVQLDHPGFMSLPKDRQLQAACNEFIGMVMFGQMLRQARDSSLNSGLFDSRAQRVFQSQLDDVLLQQAASGGATFGGLGEALHRSLSGRPPAAPPALDVKG